MLTDKRRNRAYRLALRAALAQSPHQQAAVPGLQGGQPLSKVALPRVLDIGTGTGLLAMMATRELQQLKQQTMLQQQGAIQGSPQRPSQAPQQQHGGTEQAEVKVHACELFPPMARLAKRMVAHNGLQGQIQVIPKRSDELSVGHGLSTEPTHQQQSAGQEGVGHQGIAASSGSSGAEPAILSAAERKRAAHAAAAAGGHASHASGGVDQEFDLPGRVDLVVSEILDSELLGEGVLPTMRHAVSSLLKVVMGIIWVLLSCVMGGAGGCCARDAVSCLYYWAGRPRPLD